MSRELTHGTWRASDGLTLAFRDWPAGDTAALPVLCLHGLTRNGRDFEPLAEHLAGRRVIAPDMRGRGRSQPDPDPANYHPGQYVADVWRLLEYLALERVVCLGTSLGGWMSALMCRQRPAAVAAAVLNDIGPELAPAGVARIASTAGTAPAVRTWEDALRETRKLYAEALPDLSDEQWRWYAGITYVEREPGVIDLSVDRQVGDAARRGLSGLREDPWALYDALAQRPVLLLRGAHSDILSPELFARLRRRYPEMQTAVVPNRGHAPLLDEPEALHAIDAFLDLVP